VSSSANPRRPTRTERWGSAQSEPDQAVQAEAIEIKTKEDFLRPEGKDAKAASMIMGFSESSQITLRWNCWTTHLW
tara:strand:- start:4115 stop:4342 length:228 start_codon:yes stop_codon:yes gene_type:complete